MQTTSFPKSLPQNGINLTFIGVGRKPGTANYLNASSGTPLEVSIGEPVNSGREYVTVRSVAVGGCVGVPWACIIGDRRLLPGASVIFGRVTGGPRPSAGVAWIIPATGRNSSPTPQSLREAAEKSASVALAELAFVAKQLGGQDLWTARSREDWSRDVAVFIEEGLLVALHLQLLDGRGVMIAGRDITFTSEGCRVVAKSGVELPVLDARTIRSHRLLLSHRAITASVRKKLTSGWVTAEDVPIEPGEEIVDAHSAARSGGRFGGVQRVPSSARRDLIITGTGPRFAMAASACGKFPKVKIHSVDAPRRWQPFVGMRVSAVLVVTPEGVAAKAVKEVAK